MDLLNLQRKMALKRAQIERELGIGLKSKSNSKSKSKSKTKRSRSVLQKERENALQAERNAEAAAYAAVKKPSGTRDIRRRAGANATGDTLF